MVTNAPPPFLLTPAQGEAARRLLTYVASLPPAGADAQLLAVVVAIRAARSGVGNLTGQDLRSLRLTDAEGALTAVADLGWQAQGDLLGGDPATPVAILVPDLTDETDRRLPFGKLMRSRVSGWTTRALTAKPVKKASPAARLAALFLAAHSSPDRQGVLPDDLPEDGRAALPELLTKGFLTELDDSRYRLAETVGHLSGLYLSPEYQAAADLLRWKAWKEEASAALRRHVEAVEQCPLCDVPTERVAEAFMAKPVPPPFLSWVRTAYGEWKNSHPDRGPRAARFAANFRAEHGHGPSGKQLCEGVGWGDQPSELRSFIVRRLVANEWLTSTAPVPWTLRPGRAARAGASGAAPTVTRAGAPR
ncbi:hypothetical protein AB0M87_09725 [Streptomyces sp. NPDC051320]|uniref:hypothetical protein n=1 Tax=Streptomyces sp. NPDC051320 TaxID=3154644 RepID=UPI00341F05DE